MKYKVTANTHLFDHPHSWTKGLDYEIIKSGVYFTLTSNEGQVSYKDKVKAEILANFKPFNNGNKEEFKMVNKEMVTITLEEYESLLERAEFLNCLEACGVDNWDGYSDAHEMMNEEGD